MASPGEAGQARLHAGCVGVVVVDAKPGALEFHARCGFASIDAVLGVSAARPQPTPDFARSRLRQRQIGFSYPLHGTALT